MKPISFLRDLAPIVLVGALATAVLSIWQLTWVGLLLLIILLLWRLVYHYRELNHFASWLSHPTSQNVPSGQGIWSDIFAKLYEMRRNDEHNEAELAEWLARFQNTMSHLPDGVLLMNKSSELEWCNPVAERHFGFSMARDQGNRLINVVRVPLLADLLQSKSYDLPIKLGYLHKKLELTLIEFEQERMILVSRDITEAEKIDTMRRDFIANASHELRTPLTVISGFLEYAKDDAELSEKERQRQITLMHKQAEHMTALVQDMLVLSRLESEITVDEVVIDMSSLLNEQVNQARALSSGQHHFVVHIERLNIRGSMQEIASVVSNLLSNAVRYTPEGGQIKLNWGMRDDAPTLLVEDNGMGIAPEHIPRLSERFYRVNKEQSRASKGTGLGLAIVKHVLIRHHAGFFIDSEEGVGTSFKIVFPHDKTVRT